MMFDFLHGDGGGVGITEDDHADGIADEEDRDADFVEETGHRKIVGGERGDFLAAFHPADLIGRDAVAHFSPIMSSTQESVFIMVGKPSVVVARRTVWRISSGVQDASTARRVWLWTAPSICPPMAMASLT